MQVHANIYHQQAKWKVYPTKSILNIQNSYKCHLYISCYADTNTIIIFGYAHAEPGVITSLNRHPVAFLFPVMWCAAIAIWRPVERAAWWGIGVVGGQYFHTCLPFGFSCTVHRPNTDQCYCSLSSTRKYSRSVNLTVH